MTAFVGGTNGRQKRGGRSMARWENAPEGWEEDIQGKERGPTAVTGELLAPVP